jgi:hypothetical protein
MGLLRIVGLLVCALVLAGCAFGEDGAQEVTREQLAIMVLPRDELGAQYAAFEVEDGSGPGTARDLAESTIAQDDTAASARRAGWTAGYDLTYADPVQERLAAAQRHGALAVSTSADLFATETDARAFIIGEVGGFERSEGDKVNGVKLLRVELFDVRAADEAWGLEFEFASGNETMRSTVVLFRRGRLVGSVYYLRADRADMRAQAVTLADTVARRIEQVLAGELDADPVPLPAKTVIAKPAQLARMTLTAKDLPAGARVAEEGRGRSDDHYVSYYRSFDVSNTMVGSSHLLFLRAQTDVFETAETAEAFLGYLATAKGRRTLAREVQRGFKEMAGGLARNFDVRALARPGRDAAGIVITFNLAGGRYRIASVFVRSGRAVAIISGFCNAHAVHPGDLPPLGTKARARLASIPV